MNWQLALRPRGIYESTMVTVPAPTGAAVIAELHTTLIPAKYLVLYDVAVD